MCIRDSPCIIFRIFAIYSFFYHVTYAYSMDMHMIWIWMCKYKYEIFRNRNINMNIWISSLYDIADSDYIVTQTTGHRGKKGTPPLSEEVPYQITLSRLSQVSLDRRRREKVIWEMISSIYFYLRPILQRLTLIFSNPNGLLVHSHLCRLRMNLSLEPELLSNRSAVGTCRT